MKTIVSNLKKEPMRFSKKIIIGIIIFIITMTITYTIIFCLKGSYPSEIFIALIPPCVAELVALAVMKIKEDERLFKQELLEQG